MTIKLSFIAHDSYIIIFITQQCIWKLYGFFVVDNNNYNSINVPLLGGHIDAGLASRD